MLNNDGNEIMVFDLDDTLTYSNTLMDAEMIELFCSLLSKNKCAIVTGQNYPNIHKHVVDLLPCKEYLKNLVLLPTTGTKLFYFDGKDWVLEYSMDLSEEDVDTIFKAFDVALNDYGFDVHKELLFGDRIQNRGSGVSFSAFGADAPAGMKRQWDPNGAKRRAILKFLSPLLPGFTIKIGGTTTIDITKGEIDKAFAIKKLVEFLDSDLKHVTYVGDALYEGGNDEAVLKLNIKTVDVFDPSRPTEKTKEFLRSFLG